MSSTLQIIFHSDIWCSDSYGLRRYGPEAIGNRQVLTEIFQGSDRDSFKLARINLGFIKFKPRVRLAFERKLQARP